MPEPLVLDVGTSVVALRGEKVSGDVVRTRALGDDRLLVIVVDGLGHGAPAHEAAVKAADTLERIAGADVHAAFVEAHRELRSTRGAVAAVVVLDVVRGVAQAAVLGNISVRALSIRDDVQRSTTAITTPGVLGSAFRRVHLESFDIRAGDVLVVHSDGVLSRYEPMRVRASDAQTAAEEITARAGRPHDDASCAVVRVLPASSRPPSRRPAPAPPGGVDIPLRRPGDAQVAATSARELAASSGFTGRESWEIGIAAAELAQNALKYGVEGLLTLRSDPEWLVIEAVDRGPGFGAAGSQPGLGQGLAAVERLMDSLEVLSGPLGARVITRKRLRSGSAGVDRDGFER
jgi:anti-sigma regulatory factor (Ser/Thr protein kinase)